MEGTSVLDLRHDESAGVRLNQKERAEGSRTHTWIPGVSVSARRLSREGTLREGEIAHPPRPNLSVRAA